MNIQEDYVSFETAKLLKEKGFDQNCATYYLDGQVWRHHHVEVISKGKQIYAAPTQAMAMKWLREVHQLHISVDVSPIYGKVKDEKGRNTCGLLYWHYMASGEWINDKYSSRQKAFVVSEKSYKKAIEAAIKYCFEHLI